MDTPTPPALLTSLYSLSPESSYFPSQPRSRLTAPSPVRPHVTLTFAQSLDARIAGPGGTQVALSGKESMVMTHWMRTMHDGILVGIGTALSDNPQLNTRHLPASHTLQYHLPRPIILDAHLRLPLDCKLLNNYRAGTGRRLWVLCAPDQDSSRAKALEEAGARVIEVPGALLNGKLPLPAVLEVLRAHGIESLMVEGGACVISSFMRLANEGMVDTLVVTVAPVMLGGDAVGYGADILGAQIPDTRHVETEVMGRDVVMALQVGRR